MIRHGLQACCLIAVIFYYVTVNSEAREISTGTKSSLRGTQSSAAAAATNGFADIESDDDSPREAGSKRELGELFYHHGHGGGGGGGGHHGHATSYQNFVLHSYHPKKVIYHKKHGHHHSPAPGLPIAPHHIPVPVHAVPIPTYEEAGDEESYPTY